MPRKYTRRQVLRTCAVIGASVGGASIGITSLAKMQDAAGESTPESTPEAMPGLHLDLTGAFHQIHDPSIIKGEDAYYVFLHREWHPCASLRRSPQVGNPLYSECV